MKSSNEFLEEASAFFGAGRRSRENRTINVIVLKTDDGRNKGNISFYCRALEVSRQAFYDYIVRKDNSWKYGELADEMLANGSSVMPCHVDIYAALIKKNQFVGICL